MSRPNDITPGIGRFGDVVRQYEGVGTVHHPGRGEFECEFVVAQFQDGDIRLVCEFSAENRPPIDLATVEIEGVSFRGITNDSKTVTIEDSLFIISAHYGILSEIVYVLNGPSQLHVEGPQWSGEAEIVFGLTNFRFLGTELQRVESDDGERLVAGILPLNLDQKLIAIHRLPDYEERIAALTTRGGVNVTCEARYTIKSAEEFDEIELAIRLVQILCNLLTLARSTDITWLYFDLVSPEGIVFYSQHTPATTGSFSGQSLIEWQSRDDTTHFIETAYKQYLELDPVYKLQRVVSAYVDTRSRTFIETRGLTLSSLVDYITGVLAKEQGRDPILDEKVFEARQSELEACTRRCVQETLGVSRDDASAMAAKTQGFNYRSFSNRLRLACKHFGVPTSDTEIQDFVDTRNNLVHYMTFDRGNKLSQEEVAMNFRQMIHLADKLLLRMLGYEGHFINFTTFRRELLGKAQKRGEST